LECLLTFSPPCRPSGLHDKATFAPIGEHRDADSAPVGESLSSSAGHASCQWHAPAHSAFAAVYPLGRCLSEKSPRPVVAHDSRPKGACKASFELHRSTAR